MTERMPVLFLGHGSPMNAIEDNPFSRAWREVGGRLPTPRAILCISAHWETAGVQVTAMPQPRTIHDFYGFPSELYALRYPAPGSPWLAERLCQVVQTPTIAPDLAWGLDHGSWSVLRHLFPTAQVPVVQLSLDKAASLQDHYDLGRQLAGLREEGILILGSGNMVHNLAVMDWGETAFDWAVEYDLLLRQWILDGDHQAVIQYDRHGQAGQLAVNSAEHYKPLLYVLALQQPGEAVSFFADRVTLGSISMRSLRIG